MNRLLLPLLLLAACAMPHRMPDAVLVLPADTAQDDAAADAMPTDAQAPDTAVDEDAAPVEDVQIVDAAPEDASPDVAPSDDAAVADTASDAPGDAADVPTNPCPGVDQLCGGTCVRPSFSLTMCGTTCSHQTCTGDEVCDVNQERFIVCCAFVGVAAYADTEFGGHPHGYCPPSISCPGGSCHVSTNGPDINHGDVYCCPPL